MKGSDIKRNNITIEEEQNSCEGDDISRPPSIMPPKGIGEESGVNGIKRRIQVTLEEKGTQSAMTSERSMQQQHQLSPTGVFARTRQIIDRINTTRQEILQNESAKEFPQNRVLNVQKKNILVKNATDQLRSALQVGSGPRNNQLAQTMNVRSKSSKFLNTTQSQDPTLIDNEHREQSALPQLTARIEDKQNNLIDAIQEKQNQMSRTLYKIPGGGSNNNNSEAFGVTGFAGLKYKNPFKTGRNTDRLEIPEQRSMSSISFAGGKTQELDDTNQARFKNYLPNIIRSKLQNNNNAPTITTSAVSYQQQPLPEQRKLKVILKKDQLAMELAQNLSQMRQDVSYLQEQQTPISKPTILTTGDRGQDTLLEATLQFKNLGRSLINLPQSIEELDNMLKLISKSDENNIFSIIQMPDEEERLMERYLKDNFDPIEALENLQKDGNLETKSLLNVHIPNTQLSQYLNQRTSPKRLYLQKHTSQHKTEHSSPTKAVQFFNQQPSHADLDPQKLHDEPPLIDQKPSQMSQISSKLMKKYANEAFNLGGNQTSVKKKSISKVTESVGFNLFGENQVQHLKTGSQSITAAGQDLGNPSSRQDAVILLKWYEKILSIIVDGRKSGDIKEDKQFPLLQLIMNISIKELTRQVSVHCHERGTLLTRVFSSYIRLLDLINQDHSKKRKSLRHEYALKLDRYVTLLDHQAQSYRDQILHLEDQSKKMTAELEDTQRLYKDASTIGFRYKKKCFKQQNDSESDRLRIRYLEKENKALKSKLTEIKEEFKLDGTTAGFIVSELDETDRIRLMIEVERELADLDREKKIQQSKVNALTRTSIGDQDDIFQVQDKDLIGTDDRGTTTDDFESHLIKQYGHQHKQKEVQTESGLGLNEIALDAIDMYEMGNMQDQETDTAVLNKLQAAAKGGRNTTQVSALPSFNDDIIPYDMQNMSDSSESCDEDNQENSATKDRNDPEDNNPTSLIEYLALSLVKRANQVLDREKSRLDSISEQLPSTVGDRLRRSIRQTSEEVELLSKDIKRKQREVKRSLRKAGQAEHSLKLANDKVDNLEMDNYNLREQFTEQLKILEEYRMAINELGKLIDDHNQTPSPDTGKKLKDMLTKLTDMVSITQQKYQYQIQIENLIIEDPTSNERAATTNAQSRGGHKSNEKSSGSQKKLSMQKIKSQHPAYVILKKILAKDPTKFKDQMPRKMLLRVIFQVYQEKGQFDSVQVENPQQLLIQTAFSANSAGQSAGNQTASNQNQAFSGAGISSNYQQTSLLEWIYDNFMLKYGMKNVAERKFNQLICACITYRDQLHRINLFGRYLEIYDDLPPSDYNRYLKLSQFFTQQILNFKFDENIDSTLIPLSRAQDYFRFKFEQKLIQHVFHHKMHQIDRQKVLVSSEDIKLQKHLKGAREAIDFDWFVQFVIDNYIYITDDRDQQIRDLFNAVDGSNTGMMSMFEFETVMKLFYLKSSKYIQRVFEEYSQPTDPQNPMTSKMLNIDQFFNLSMDRELFTPKVLHTVIKSRNPEKDFERLQPQLASVISIFKARLSSAGMVEDEKYGDLLENLRTCITYPVSPQVGWLCFRIIDETFKRMYLKKKSDSLMPIDLSKVTEIKLKPSSGLIGSLPVNYFETQH